jgi:hypothetical protein
MKRWLLLYAIWMMAHTVSGQSLRVEFCGESLSLPQVSWSASGKTHYAKSDILAFQQTTLTWENLPLRLRLEADSRQLNDWFTYQLIRRTAQQLCPKASDYERYTLMKWWLLSNMGYQTLLRRSDQQLLLYVQSDDVVYNIPSRIVQGKTFVCLNFHDYSDIDFNHTQFEDIWTENRSGAKSFSYQINHLPLLPQKQYEEKKLSFAYHTQSLDLSIRVNPEMNRLLNNYPTLDYAAYLNIPLSAETYQSLIPPLMQAVKGKSQREGIEYLMHFSRFAFAFQSDKLQFGGEKRLIPEQTLLYNQSDCDDRAALFFCLVKEIYNLPMIILAYPEHVTVAVALKQGKGKPILYEGSKYYICEPTPQRIDLGIGDILPEWRNQPYEISYAYRPSGF